MLLLFLYKVFIWGAYFVHECLLWLREDTFVQIEGDFYSLIKANLIFGSQGINNIDDVITVNGHDLTAFDHRRLIVETGVPLNRHVCSYVKAFDLGGDVADDHTVGILVSHIVLADYCVVIALHNVTSG